MLGCQDLLFSVAEGSCLSCSWRLWFSSYCWAWVLAEHWHYWCHGRWWGKVASGGSSWGLCMGTPRLMEVIWAGFNGLCSKMALRLVEVSSVRMTGCPSIIWHQWIAPGWGGTLWQRYSSPTWTVVGCGAKVCKHFAATWRPRNLVTLSTALPPLPQCLVSEPDLFSVHCPELIMISHLQHLGPLHSHSHSLLGLSCCLLSLSHPHCHFFILLLQETYSCLSLLLSLGGIFGLHFAQPVRYFTQPVWHFTQLVWHFAQPV